MSRFNHWTLGIVVAAMGWLALGSSLNAAVLFSDDFESDTVGTDPVIGAGDIGGSWDMREPTEAYGLVDTDGSNKYLDIIRGDVLDRARPWATGTRSR